MFALIEALEGALAAASPEAVRRRNDLLPEPGSNCEPNRAAKVAGSTLCAPAGNVFDAGYVAGICSGRLRVAGSGLLDDRASGVAAYVVLAGTEFAVVAQPSWFGRRNSLTVLDWSKLKRPQEGYLPVEKRTEEPGAFGCVEVVNGAALARR